MRRVEDELHRLRVAMLDRTNPRHAEYWAAQQALSWVLDQEAFAPPFFAVSRSAEGSEDCSAQHRPQSFSDTSVRLGV